MTSSVYSPRRSSRSGRRSSAIGYEANVLCCLKFQCVTGSTARVITALQNGGITPSPIKFSKDVDILISELSKRNVIVVLCEHHVRRVHSALKSRKVCIQNDKLLFVSSDLELDNLFHDFCVVFMDADKGPTQLINTVTSWFSFYQNVQSPRKKQTLRPSISCTSIYYNLDEKTNLLREHTQREEKFENGCQVLDFFINTKTKCPEEGLRGVFVRESACSFQDIPGDIGGFEDFLKTFVTAEKEKSAVLTKTITAKLIPQCQEDGDFVTLLQLTGGGDSRLKKHLLEAAYDIQLSTTARACNIHRLFIGLDSLVNLFQRCILDLEFVERTTPLFLNTVSLLFLCMVERDIDNTQMQDIQTRSSQILHTASEMRGKGSTSAGSLYPVTEILSCFVDQLNTNFKLQHRKYRDHLSSKKLHRQPQKLPFLELYTMVFEILQALKHGSATEDISTLKYVVGCLLDKLQKKTKTGPLIHAILVCITQGLTRLIIHASECSINGKSQESMIKDLAGVMDMYFDSQRCALLKRTQLLREVESLLFLKYVDLVQNVVYWHNRSGIQSQKLQNKALEHIEILLQPINFSILKADYVPNIAFSPAWCCLHGLLGSSRHVTLHCLLPSQNSLLEGTMADYKVNADKSETRSEINTLEILRIVQSDRNYPGIVSLHAYQCRPLPLFYIVDRFKDADLFSHLQQRRQEKDWLSKRFLAALSHDIILALEFLHSKKVIHRNLTASSFSLDSQKNVVLTDFSIARHVDATEISLSDLMGTGVPTRWTAPESLLEGKFDMKTDVWMVGQLLYEIYTHGCQPYVELNGIPTEKVMEWVVFQHLKPKQWPCIPLDVHDIILKCVQTDADDRINLSAVNRFFDEQRQSRVTSQPRLPMSRAYDEDRLYPELPSGPKSRSTTIERGVPKLFLDLRKGPGGPRKSYMFLNALKVQRPVSDILVTHQDLLAPDQPVYQQNLNFTEVKEPVTQEFVESVYPLLTGDVMKWLHIRHWPIVVQHHKSSGPADYNCALVYGCEKGENILDFALVNRLGDPTISEIKKKYFHVVESIANFIQCMHSKNFILRDLCATNIFYCLSSGKIFMPRLGRILHLSSNCALDDSILAEKFDNRERWMPIEVLQSAQYSKQSDVYMFAMVLYEFFMALEMTKTNSDSNFLKTAPFATTKSALLLETLYSGQMPEKPKLCPTWLYEIMELCWDRDRTTRPDISDVHIRIRNRLQYCVSATGQDNDNSRYDTFHQSSNDRGKRSSQYQKLSSRSISDTNLSMMRPPRPIGGTESVLRESNEDVHSCDRGSGASCFCTECDIPPVPLRPTSRPYSNDRISGYDRIFDERATIYDKIEHEDDDKWEKTMNGLTDVGIKENLRNTFPRQERPRLPTPSEAESLKSYRHISASQTFLYNI